MGFAATMTEAGDQSAQAPVVHCILHDGVITFVSANSVDLTGLPPEHFQGRHWRDVIHPDDQAPLLVFAAPNWEGIIDATFRVRDASGAWTWRRAQGVRTIESDGHPSSIVTVRSIDPPAAG